MNWKLQDILYAKYPKLFTQKDSDMRTTAMCWGIDANDGWFDLIDGMCAKLSRFYPTVEFTQMKEKWGALVTYLSWSKETQWQRIWYGAKRWFYNVLDPFAIVNEAEERSRHICEVCGQPGKLREDLVWVLTLCDEDYWRI